MNEKDNIPTAPVPTTETRGEPREPKPQGGSSK